MGRNECLCCPSGTEFHSHARQERPNECGLACLVMVAAHHGIEIGFPVLRRLCSLPPKGARLKALIGAAARIGLDARALMGCPEHFERLALPAILHWDEVHFVVLAALEQDASGLPLFRIHDPARGPRSFGEAELSAHFTGAMLELTPADRPMRVPAEQPATPLPDSKVPRRKHLAFHSPTQPCGL